ncbi:C13 family peptidase [Marinobacter sp. CHS3-4]|uniref:C13 family peptidase n=1 Tax=Marinobacter sp. CHS3-4 TaxID=3045174 RepID=UPI0024B547D0|nr:C13 family peptidase [Marinobacter sp. CHS3-4]MDI9244263.1 C13 family peptidase [Marinobacter sp. CHS3-4]
MVVASNAPRIRTLTLLLISFLGLVGCDAATLLPPDARLPDGSTYSGETKEGYFHGEGVQEFVDGMVYRGRFSEGYWHGEGVLVLPDSWRYEGDFQKGAFHGEGRFETDSDVYIGTFEKGKPLEGRHITDYGTYQGEFKNWLYHGEGTFAYINEYEGIGRMSGIWEQGELVEGDDTGRQEPTEPEPLTERILAEDRNRLDAQISDLVAERAGQVDVYFLAVGGDGTESVFKRDIQVARRGLQQAFDIQNRAITLLNHRDYDSFPLATRPSINTALKALDQRMNPTEDLLVVHLVSHGHRNGNLLLQQPGMELPDLSPSDFAQMLEPLKARRKLLVVSACFSGQWIDALKDSGSWILTSARKDRTSFGCGDDSEMTWFTKALYQEVGLAFDNPNETFEAVKSQIRAWEEEIGMDEEAYSYPQVFLGEDMKHWLKQR